MLRYLSSGLVSLPVFACALGAGGPRFEYAPSKLPLRYAIENEQIVVVETPMGAQEANDNTNATVALGVGKQQEDGWQVSAVFEALSGQVTGVGSINGEEFVGKPFSGTLNRNGTIDITEAPEIAGSLAQVFDAKGFLADFLAPTPPSGTAELATWQVRRETVSETQIKMTSSFVGTALIVGDTTWNGESAKIIGTTGTFTLEGTGTPTGSPSEMDMVVTGEATTRYVWDFKKGVMLGAAAKAEGTGKVTLVGMDISMPVSLTVSQRVELQR